MIALHQALDICVECPLSIQVLFLGTFFVAAVKLALWMARSFKKQRPYAGFPIMVTPGMSPQQSWQQTGHELIDIGARTGSPFQVMTGTGPKIVLPNRFAEEIKAHPDLSFSGAVSNDFFAHMSGFEAFKVGNEEGSGNLVVDVVRGNLTQSLGLITPDLVDEALCSIHDLFGENSDWHTAPVKDQILTLVARLSSRVFLGMELCRNETWLGIAKTYTVSAFMAARELRRWPALLQPLAHRFLKHSCEIRNMYRDAGKLIAPVIDRRRARAAKALAAGQKPPKMADTIGWMHEKAKGAPLDYVAAQLGLSLAAIHTTTESLVQALSDVCAHPELQQSLREEAIQVIREEGWSRTGLYKMRLMDSFLKESQRCHPGQVSVPWNGSTVMPLTLPCTAAMSRKALKKITLSDGTIVPKNAIIMLTTRFADPDLYKDAEKFDALRFLRLREASAGQSTYQHVTVSPEHLSFGYGPHACPGRFFASNEIKIALSALLLKYDWSFVEGQTIEDCFFRTEAQLMTRPQVSLRLRRRREEIPLEPSKDE